MSLTDAEMKGILEHLAIREGYKFTAAEGVLGFQGAYYSLTTGDGQQAYFIKCVPQGSKMVDEFYRQLGTFTKEIPVYLEAFPKMENFGCVWSRCYLGKPGRFLVLEDLTVAGWRVPEAMDADHINVALKGLAEFHAASLQLLDSSEDFVKWAQTKLAETMFSDDSRLPGRRMWDAYCRLAAMVVRRYSPQFDDVDVFEILQKSVLSVKTSRKFKNCLNHGDPWKNNIFFKYNNDKPTSCRFVDFQSCRFAPPALDVSIFINIFAPDKYDELTLTYHKHLVNTSTTTILTTEELRDSSDFFKGPGINIASLYVFLTNLPSQFLSKILISQETFIQFALGSDYSPAFEALEQDVSYRQTFLDSLQRAIHYHTRGFNSLN